MAKIKYIAMMAYEKYNDNDGHGRPLSEPSILPSSEAIIQDV